MPRHSLAPLLLCLLPFVATQAQDSATVIVISRGTSKSAVPAASVSPSAASADKPKFITTVPEQPYLLRLSNLQGPLAFAISATSRIPREHTHVLSNNAFSNADKITAYSQIGMNSLTPIGTTLGFCYEVINC